MFRWFILFSLVILLLHHTCEFLNAEISVHLFSSILLRCVKPPEKCLTSCETRCAVDFNCESEIGSLSQSLSLPLSLSPLFLRSLSEAFLGLSVFVPQPSLCPQLTSLGLLRELGHGRNDERQTFVCEELSCVL